MLDSLLAGLQQVGEECDAQGIEVGILGGDGALPTQRGRAVAAQTFAGLQAVYATVAPADAVHGCARVRGINGVGKGVWPRLGACQGRSRGGGGDGVVRMYACYGAAAAAQWNETPSPAVVGGRATQPDPSLVISPPANTL